MKAHRPHSGGVAAGTALALFASVALVHAATIKDMTLVWTGDRFDPSGFETVDAEPTALPGEFTPQETLEARTDLGVLQDVRQSAGIFAPVDNIVYFTDPEMPAVFFNFTQNARAGSAGNQTDTSTYKSSAGEAFRVIGNNNASAPTILVMEFGTYADGTFTANKQVQAAGFVMTSIRTGHTVVVEFKTARNGTVLATQTFVGYEESAGNYSDAYFGYASDSYNIGAVVMSRYSSPTSLSQTDSAIDDIGWTKVPLPPPATVLFLR